VITAPTTPQLIDAACTELSERVAPNLTDPTAKIVLEMAIAVLQGAARRSASEMAWMREEADAIEAVALGMLDDLSDGQRLTDALAAYSDGRTDSLYLSDAIEQYHRATEVLSCAAEAAYESGNAEQIAAVKGLIDQRMANERGVIGVFLAAGRE
jgi:hypothetical protein